MPGSRRARGCRSSRRLSEQLAIARNTVVRAYDELLMEGIVEARPASGIYVVEQPAAHPGSAQPLPAGSEHPLHTLMPMPLRKTRVESPPHSPRNRLLFDFFPGPAKRGAVSAQDLAPAAAGQLDPWRRRRPRPIWRSGGPAGVTHRHRQSSRRLARHRRGPPSHRHRLRHPGRPDYRGAAVPARGALSVVEDPCYRRAASVFEAAGAEVTGVAVDRDA